MGVFTCIGVMLVLLGIVLIVYDLIKIIRSSSKETTNELDTDIQFLGIIKLKGGKSIILIAIGFFLMVLDSGFLPQYNLSPNSPPSVEIKSVSYEHNAQEDNLLGMKIQVWLDTHNLKDEDCLGTAYFCFSNGVALKDFNKFYNTADGYVCAGTTFTPNSVDTFSDHLIIFIPYNELHMDPGSYQLAFRVVIWGGGTKLAESNLMYFDYIQYPY